MATAQQPAKTTPPGEAVAPKKKRSKLVLIIGVLLVLAAGGGGAWYFMRPADPNAPVAQAKPKPAIFQPLEMFTVNLLSNDGQPQYIQTSLTLKLSEEKTAELVKEHMPEVRDRILMVLSGKRGGDLIPVSGKQKLAADIAEAVKNVIAPHAAAPAAAPESSAKPGEAQAAAPAEVEHAAPAAPKVEVLFTAFIIQ